MARAMLILSLVGVVVAVFTPAAQAAPTVTIKTSDRGTVQCSSATARVASGGYRLVGGSSSLQQAVFNYPSAAGEWTAREPRRSDDFQTAPVVKAYAVCVLGGVTFNRHSKPLTPGAATSVTCPDTRARAVGGGFQAGDVRKELTATDSYPSGPRTWTVKASKAGTAWVVCGISSLRVNIHSVPLRSGTATVTCPDSFANALGGGYSVDGPVKENYPSAARSWTVKTADGASTGRAYVVCAVQ